MILFKWLEEEAEKARALAADAVYEHEARHHDGRAEAFEEVLGELVRMDMDKFLEAVQSCIDGLVEQQAMPDDRYLPTMSWVLKMRGLVE